MLAASQAIASAWENPWRPVFLRPFGQFLIGCEGAATGFAIDLSDKAEVFAIAH